MNNAQSDGRRPLIWRALLLSVAVGLFYFSYSLARYSNTNTIDPSRNVALFSNYDRSESDKRQWRSKVKEISEQLEFMVWKRERQALLAELIDLQQSAINANPFDASLWRDLGFIYRDSNRVWALKQAAKLQKWNQAARFQLAHHCVNDYRVFQQDAEKLCDELISALPLTPSIANLARKVGVSEREMRAVLEQEGLLKEGSGERVN